MAADTADALREKDRGSVRLTYDVSRYTGPVLHPIAPTRTSRPSPP
ncbi:D-alanyl-D-alanine carboxypeptidase [Streptomyces badius]